MKKICIKAFVLVLTICILSTSAVAYNDIKVPMELSLEDAISYALNNSNTLKITDITIKNQINVLEDAKQIKEDLQKVRLTYSFENKPDDPLATALQNALIKKGYFELQNEYDLEELNKSKENAEAGIKLSVEQNYYSLKASEDKVDIEKENLDRSEKEYELVKQKYELGTATKIDVLSSEFELERAKTDYQNAIDDYEYQRLLFNKTVGLDFDTKVVLTDELVYVTLDNINLDEKIDMALTDSYDYLTSKHQYELAKKYMDIVSMIYTSSTDAYKMAKDNLEIAQYTLEDVKKEITLKVTKAYMDLIKAERNLKTAQKSVELAKQAYEIAKISYETGMNTALDVSKARISLREAELGYNQALLAYNLAIKNFEMSYK